MICRLCLKDIIDVINIFDETGIELNVAAVLAKYFWFEPRHDDPISTAICTSCWTNVFNFNDFYLGVEEAHRLLTERFSLKNEGAAKCHKKRKFSVCVDNVDEWLHTSLPSDISKTVLDPKHEQIKVDCPDNDNRQLETKDETDFEEKKQLKSEKLWSDDQLSIGSETFIEEVIGLVEESEGDALALPEELQLRSSLGENTDSTPDEKDLDVESENVLPAQLKLHSNTSEKKKYSKPIKTKLESKSDEGINEDYEEDGKKRRGRPSKTKPETNKIQKPKKGRKTKKSPSRSHDSQEESYEERMRQIDQKISQCVRLICDICAIEQPTFSTLRKHMEKAHQCKGYATCCNKKFNKRALLYGHVEKHLNPDCYKCESCDKTFADKQCMRNHFLIKHQPEEAKQYQCEHCPKRFARPYILEQHRLIHEERKHICEVCKRGFATSNMLSTHMKIMHFNYGATMCDVCAKVIRGRTAFARHQLEHTGIVLPKVQCDKCGSWHKDKYSLQKHKRRHNDDGTVHVCTICGKVAPNRSALLSHQRYVHKSDRVFECGVCKKAFKKAITLKEHMTMHTGEVLYSCPHCPKTFNSNANMHSHRKKIHPIEFEETRKLRRENSAKTNIRTDQSGKKVISNLEQSQRKGGIGGNSDDNSKDQMIIIKSANGEETHSILVTTEGFSDNDDGDGDMNDDSIVFTIT